jgi:menaquinone-dependent protoporphyrinogen oxidase
MKKILVVYATNAGSTTEVAQVIGEELSKSGAQVEVRQIADVVGVEGYDAVVVGAPMMMGWHRSAVRFIKKHQQSLSRIQVTYFLMAMNLTQASQKLIAEERIFIDPWLAKPPKNPDRLSLKERYATVANYLRPALKAAPSVRPVSSAFFGGKLELFRLKLHQMLFVMLIIQAQPGDLRNWPVIKGWAAALGSKFGFDQN